MHVHGSMGWGEVVERGRSKVYKKRLPYAIPALWLCALVVQVAYLIFIRSLLEYSASFASFFTFAYFASFLVFSATFFA